jgi:hypothetical protein
LWLCGAGLLAFLCPGFSGLAQPIQLHPANPHYFLWRGKPTVLLTSGEHYGMVVNRDLDWRRYLETLRSDGLNYTRVFAGAYVEKAGAFGIARNNLAPDQGKFLAPWARSAVAGYAGGGNKFDLTRWNPDYFARLTDFTREAGQRGIVVEVTLFSSIYNDEQWSVNAFNPSNNVNGTRLTDWRRLHTRTNDGVLGLQEAYVRQVVRALNSFDNVFYEIQNEPWSDHHVMGDSLNPYLTDKPEFPNAVEITTPTSLEWQAAVAAWITREEATMPQRHLIAQNVANFRLPVRETEIAPGVGILNFHYAFPEAVTWNYGLGRLIGYDESGFAGGADETYRREAWSFLLAGGGLFNHLDYSFTPGAEDGSDIAPNGPGGGSPALRRQLKALGEFIRSFNFVALRPDPQVVRKSPGVVSRVLSQPGVAYALYLRGRSPCSIELELPAGAYRADWVETASGRTLRSETFVHRGGARPLASPPFQDDLALRLFRTGR